MKILSVFGTRPEAIKMAPVVRALSNEADFEHHVCVTGQHREMLSQVLEAFSISPDFDLKVMAENQSLADVTTAVLKGMDGVLRELAPDRLLVHGDTTTTLAAALSGYYHRIPVGHVEAGLRTGNPLAPWPEELNRRLADHICDLHFAPTESAKANLIAEGIAASGILVTGNTVVDALLETVRRIEREPALKGELKASLPELAEDRPVVLVTGHRRENFGQGFQDICTALLRLASERDVQIVYPVHLNPNVKGPVETLLGGQDNIHLLPPLGYMPFVYLMNICHFIVTDSGGIQEEAPSLGKPVLVMRDVSERPEAIEAGTVKLVGTDAERIFHNSAELLDDEDIYNSMSRAANPYGDGKAAARIVGRLRHG